MVLVEGKSTLLVDHVQRLRDVVAEAECQYPFEVAPVVVLPTLCGPDCTTEEACNGGGKYGNVGLCSPSYTG